MVIVTGDSRASKALTIGYKQEINPAYFKLMIGREGQSNSRMRVSGIMTNIDIIQKFQNYHPLIKNF